MRRSAARSGSFAAFLLLALLLPGLLPPFAVPTRAAAAQGARPVAPERLLFLLEYIGSDYDGAVRGGAVVNRLEYAELLRFAKELVAAYEGRPGRTEDLLAGLRHLEQLIERRAPADQVWTTTRRLLPLLASSLGGGARPPAPPDLANGRRLWASDCALCHGSTGSGDGHAAADMEPPPTPFRGRFLERLSPRQVYNALTVGIDDTAMPSFADAYSEQQRWDVAFHVMTLRVGFDPKQPKVAVDLPVAELAVRSNAELLDLLRAQSPQASPEEVDYLRVNFGDRAASAGGGAGAGGGGGVKAGGDAKLASAGLATALQLQDVFADIAERVAPRVVGVVGYRRDPDWTPERLRGERGDAWITAHEEELRYPGYRGLRSASGLLVDDDGYVLTTDHAVRGDDGEILALIDVELPDESHVPVTVVGAEPTLDLAVLRLADPARHPDAPPLELGDSDHLAVGHWLIALGDPQGAEKTFAIGVVAAPPERQCYQEHLSATLLQSSLAFAPGGLGGPVVDIFGRLVGVSVRPQSLGGVAAGTPGAGALPINLVLTLVEALKVAQSTRSPWIGVSVLELALAQKRLAKESKAPAMPAAGLYIDDVFAPSPASLAGVRPGDFLLALGGHPLRSVADFQTWLYVSGIGSKVDLDLLREGKPLRLGVTIEVRPDAASNR